MIYLPGQPVVPCAVCGTTINRRGRGGQGHRKYCSKACHRVGKRELARLRTGQQPRRTDNLCRRCNINETPQRPSGRSRRSWCRSCESAQKGEYMRTLAGKATMRRFYEKQMALKGVKCWWCEQAPGEPYKGRRYMHATCQPEAKAAIQ